MAARLPKLQGEARLKALTLHQPWAGFMAIGAKWNETRPRKWCHLGDLAICSARRPMDLIGCKLIAELKTKWGIVEGIEQAVIYGKVLCVVQVWKCVPSNEFNSDYANNDLEASLGDYRPGRFIYLTTFRRRLREPVEVVGRQGLFNLPPDVEAKVRAQL